MLNTTNQLISENLALLQKILLNRDRAIKMADISGNSEEIKPEVKESSCTLPVIHPSTHSMCPSYTSIGIASPPTPSHVVVSSGSTVCRICHTNTVHEKLISPCNCKGSLAYIHLSCLERWLNQASRSYCELCMFRFNSVQTPRYGVCESLRLWTRHPRNRQHFHSDVLICCLLTVITLGLVAICLLGMEYFVIEGTKLGVTRAWTRGTLSFFLGMIVTGYLLTVYLLVKDQLLPWYVWWKNTVDVKLLLPVSICHGNGTTANVPNLCGHSNWRESTV